MSQGEISRGNVRGDVQEELFVNPAEHRDIVHVTCVDISIQLCHALTPTGQQNPHQLERRQ